MLDFKQMTKNFEDYLNSEKGKKATEEWMQKLKKEDDFQERWVEKFVKFLENKTDEELSHLYFAFEKHETKRRDILYGQGIDGQTDLYIPLMEAFERLGAVDNVDAYSDFSSAVFDWRGYRLELYCGQGCYNRLTKI
jgi:hypothetical protein